MKIISHRGKFSKQSAENDISTILKTDAYQPAYIEIDIQLNKSEKAILVHDNIAGYELAKIDGLPLLDNLLRLKLKTPLLIEIKQPGIAKIVLEQLNAEADFSFTTFHIEDARFLKNKIDKEIFIMQRLHPFGLFKKCVQNNFDGIGMNKNWLIFVPFIYQKCLRNNKKLILYTLNSKILAKLLSRLMPETYICTDKTKKFITY